MIYTGLCILGIVLAVTIISRAIFQRGVSTIARDPLILFSLYFSIIHFITPLAKYWEGKFRYQNSYEEISFIYTAAFSIAFFLFGCFWSEYFRRKYARAAFPKVTTAGSGALIAGYVLCAVGVAFSVKDLSAIQGAAGGVESFLSDRHSFAEERGSYRVFSNFLLVGTALLLAGKLNVHVSRLFVPVYVGTFGFAIFYFNLLSSRNSVLILFILNVGVYLFYRVVPPKITRKTLFVTVSIVAGGVAIASGAYKITVERYSVTDNSYMEERRQNVMFYMLDGAFGNDEARLWFVEHGQEYHLGATYLAALTNFVPRKIWAEKPLGAGPRLINTIRPGSYVIGSEGNNSLTTGLVVESQMNFGEVGVFIIIILWAWLANYLIKKAGQSISVLRQVACLVASISLCTMFVYSEFLGYAVRLAFFIVPIAILSLVPIRVLRLSGESA